MPSETEEINWIDNLDIVAGDHTHWNSATALYAVCMFK